MSASQEKLKKRLTFLKSLVGKTPFPEALSSSIRALEAKIAGLSPLVGRSKDD